MAQKTVTVSDITGEEINGDSAKITIVSSAEPNARYVIDASLAEVSDLVAVAHKQKRRGRPKAKKPVAA